MLQMVSTRTLASGGLGWTFEVKSPILNFYQWILRVPLTLLQIL